MKDKEPTNQELLEAISDSFTAVEERISKSETKLKEKIDELKIELRAEFRAEIAGIKSTMATKAYIDQKFCEHKMEQPTIAEKADRRVTHLTRKLQYKKVLSVEEVFDILG